MIGLAAPSSLIQKKSNFSGTLKRKRETRKCNTWQRIWFELTSEAINIQRQEEKLKDVQQAIRLLQCENMLKQKVVIVYYLLTCVKDIP